MKGSEIPTLRIASKCQSEYNSIKKKKDISLQTTGDQKTNLLLNLLRCQVKATTAKSCKEIEKEYTKCHQSFMGTGSYKGKKHCGDELQALYDCVLIK
jgi:hypothetical protein